MRDQATFGTALFVESIVVPPPQSKLFNTYAFHAKIKYIDLLRLNAVSRVGHIRKPRVTQQMEDSLPVHKLLLLYLHLLSYVQRHSSGKNITKETMSHVSLNTENHLENNEIFLNNLISNEQ